MADFPGTLGDDTINGTVQADTIADGGGGNDTLNGLAGNDVITSTGGGDTVDGGDDRDRLLTNYFNTANSATVSGSFSGTVATGYSGIFASSGRSVSFSNIEDFSIITDDGADTLVVGDGDDNIQSFGGDDNITAGQGNDVLDGGTGTDRLSINLSDETEGVTINLSIVGMPQQSGGTGQISNFETFVGNVFGTGFNDVLIETQVSGNGVFDLGSGDDFLEVALGVDEVDGGAGNDRLSVNYFNTANSATSSGAFSGDLATGYSGSFASSGRSVSFTNVENFSIFTDVGSDTIVTGDGDDTVSTSGGDDRVTVGQGNDVLDAGANTDSLSIDLSDELTGVIIDLTIGGGAQQQTGGTGSIIGFETFFGAVIGSALNDSLTEAFAAGDATFDMGNGDDFVEVALGVDTVNGGAGNDRLSVNYSNTSNSAVSSGSFTGSLALGYSGTFASSGRSVTFSGIENFNVTTDEGADTIVTGDGSDTVTSFGGNDRVTVGKGNDMLDGGTGIDGLSIDLSDELTGVTINLDIIGGPQQSGGTGSIINFESFAGAVTGSAQNDSLTESNVAGDATFSLGAGNDFVQVVQGVDSVDGGTGNDRLSVSYFNTANSATTSGSFSGDLQSGYSGIFASSGRNVSFSGIENFTIVTDDGADVIVTGDGNDNVTTTGGNDRLTVGQGNDVVDGGVDTDSLSINLSDELQGVTIDLSIGGGGEQQTGGTGSIRNFETFFGTVTGSAFDDRFTETGASADAVFNMGTGDDFVRAVAGIDTVNGGDGRDTLFVDYAATANSATSSGSLSGSLATGYSGIFASSGRSISFSGVEDFILATDDGSDTLVTGDGNDVFTTTGGNDNITAAGGDDFITAGAGNDSINGGDGSDTASYADGIGSVTVNLNILVAQAVGGGLGSDTLTSIENLVGSDFNDTLTGDGVANTLRGGIGDDALNGGDGSDTADYSDGTSGVTVDLTLAGAQAVGGGLGSDTLNSIENLTGSDFADILMGDAGDNQLLGGAGGDNLFGGAGNDLLGGGTGVDTVSYAAAVGAVTVSLALNTAQTIGGGMGDDTLIDVERLIGSGFNDILTGSDGNDALLGGGGNDLMEGGAGDDALDGGGNTDTASYANAASFVRVDLSNSLAQNTRGAGFDTLVNIERLLGSGFNDALFGNAGNNRIDAGDGVDRVVGGDGNDVLYGDGGDDRLIGSAGNDALYGGTGNDLYDVREAGDTVTEAANAGTDTVQSFVDFTLGANVERLELFGEARVGTGNTLANTIFGGNGGDTLSGLDGNDVLRGNGSRDTLLGGDGLDLLDGGAGVDTMTGGSGRDQFQFRDGDTIGSRVNCDVITDFDQALDERIQLALVDANTNVAGDQSFEWIGTAGFSGTAGELRYVQVSGNTFIEGDLDGNGVSDYTIQLTGLYTLDTGDFTGVVDLFP